MERREFLGSLTGPVAAVCAVCMGACSKTAGSSNSGSPITPPTANFTIDLASNLLTVGSSMVQSGVIVVRLATGNTIGSFTAVQVACTHEGTSINWNAPTNGFLCPNHGSRFTSAGSVTLGPASSNLKAYNVSISGNIMTVSG